MSVVNGKTEDRGEEKRSKGFWSGDREGRGLHLKNVWSDGVHSSRLDRTSETGQKREER